MKVLLYLFLSLLGGRVRDIRFNRFNTKRFVGKVRGGTPSNHRHLGKKETENAHFLAVNDVGYQPIVRVL
jgi:hypothetical protein